MKKTVSRIVAFAGSQAVACTVLAFLFLLTFLGTIDQAKIGLFEAQKKYFDSLLVVYRVGGVVPVPLPGVYLLLVVLAVNLVIGGLVTIRKSRATIGVIVVHLGILLLLGAGFVKLHFSVDGHLTLFERQMSDEFQSYHEWEVAIFDATATSNVRELIVPDDEWEGLTGDRSRRFESDELPFAVTLSRHERNATVVRAESARPGEAIDGFALESLPLAKEAEQNVAGLIARIDDKQGGASRQAILWGFARHPFTFEAGGKTWAVDLRHRRYKMPFTIALDRFTRELYPRTQIPKVFMSEVTKIEGGVSERRRIEMNEPLRQDGLVLFQASWGPEGGRPGELFSTFAVVRNPSDQWPLIACIVINVGMLIAFAQKLASYVRTQAAGRRA